MSMSVICNCIKTTADSSWGQKQVTMHRSNTISLQELGMKLQCVSVDESNQASVIDSTSDVITHPAMPALDPPVPQFSSEEQQQSLSNRR